MDNTNTKTNQKGLRTEQLSQYRAFAKPLDQEAEQSCQHTQHQRIIHHPKGRPSYTFHVIDPVNPMLTTIHDLAKSLVSIGISQFQFQVEKASVENQYLIHNAYTVKRYGFVSDSVLKRILIDHPTRFVVFFPTFNSFLIVKVGNGRKKLLYSLGLRLVAFKVVSLATLRRIKVQVYLKMLDFIQRNVKMNQEFFDRQRVILAQPAPKLLDVIPKPKQEELPYDFADYI